MTTEELVAFPDDGIDRWLIRGELRSRPWNHRTPAEGATITATSTVLNDWARQSADKRGVALIDAFHRLGREPDTTLGIDISLIRKDQWDSSRRRAFVDGVPIVAVEIQSPKVVHPNITEKVQEYLEAGVNAVWVIDPDFETIGVYQPAIEPQFFNRGENLTADRYLPGFRVRVAELFE